MPDHLPLIHIDPEALPTEESLVPPGDVEVRECPACGEPVGVERIAVLSAEGERWWHPAHWEEAQG